MSKRRGLTQLCSGWNFSRQLVLFNHSSVKRWTCENSLFYSNANLVLRPVFRFANWLGTNEPVWLLGFRELWSAQIRSWSLAWEHHVAEQGYQLMRHNYNGWLKSLFSFVFFLRPQNRLDKWPCLFWYDCFCNYDAEHSNKKWKASCTLRNDTQLYNGVTVHF